MQKKIYRLDQITTKNGDGGETNLVERTVHKTDPIISCIGQIDSLNAAVGSFLYIYQSVIQDVKTLLEEIQNNLFTLSADIICNTKQIGQSQIDQLKSAITNISFAESQFDPLAILQPMILETRVFFQKNIESDSDSTFASEYLENLALFFNKLSALIAARAPWANCASLIILISEKLARTELLCGKWTNDFKEILDQIYIDLRDLQSDICHSTDLISNVHIKRTEEYITNINKILPPLTSFVIPKGPSAPMHSVRTTVRETEIAFLKYIKVINKTITDNNFLEIQKYINRLSDLIFVLCRKMTHGAAAPEDLWVRKSKNV